MKKNNLIFLVVLVLSLSMILAACSPSPSNDQLSEGNQANEGDQSSESSTAKQESSSQVADETSAIVLKIGAMKEFNQSTEARSLIFDFPLHSDETGRVVPYVIKEWSVNDDFSEYTIKFQTGIKFHDGSDLTADILKGDIEYWGPFRHVNYPKFLSEVLIVDDETLLVKFKEKYTSFMKDLVKIYITKPEDVDEQGNITGFNGTGPFILEKSDTTKASLNRNDNYWNKEKMPAIEKLEWITIPDNNARKMALESGQIDVLGVSEHHGSLDYELESELEKKPGFKLIREKFRTIVSYSLNWLNGPLKDINLRKAINYAVDREALVEKLFLGIPTATSDYLNPKYVDGPKNQISYDYDLEKAKEYLEKGGYKDTDGNGIVEKDGQEIKLVLTTIDKKEYKDVAVFVQSELRKIGVDVEIKATAANINKEAQAAGDFDLARVHPWTTPLANHMKWRGLLKGYDNYGAGYNVDPQIEELAKQLAQAESDQEIAKIADQIWKIEYDFAPILPMYTRGRFIVYNDKFDGFKLRENVMFIDLSEVTVN